MTSRMDAERSRPDGAVGDEIPGPDRDEDDGTVGAEEPDRGQGPITNPHEGDAANTEPQEPRELENPPQERGPRERQNDAV